MSTEQSDAPVSEASMDFDPTDGPKEEVFTAKALKAVPAESEAEAQSEEKAEDVTTEEEASEQEKDEPSESSTEKNEGEVPPERIEEVTKKFRTQERQTEYWKERALAAENTKAPDDGVAPQFEKSLEDFEYDVSAYTQYVAQETIKTQAERQQAEATQQDANQVLESHLSREAEFSAKVSDYKDVALNPYLNVTPLMADICRRSEQGPEMLYHLGQNPEVSTKISQLSPQLQAVEMGQILNKVATSKPAPPKTDNPPPKTLEGKKPARRISASSAESDSLSDEEWLKRRRKEVNG